MAKILVVDDDPDFVEAARIVLQKHHHEIISAASGNAGFKRAKEEKPDLIILDVIMDTLLAGVSVSQRLHNDPELRHIPIIMVTSIVHTDYVEFFPTDEDLHVHVFLSKPVSASQLVQQIDRLLAKSQ